MKKLIFASILLISGCSSLRAITPEDRAEAYRAIAAEIETKCKVYHFDLSSNLTPEVPEMTKVCK
jgi:hypothetical protein